MKQNKGRFTISRVSSNMRSEYILVGLDDGSSHARIVSIEIELAEFAAAMTGLGYMECEFTLYEDAPVGKVVEVKREQVCLGVRDAHRMSDEELREILKPFEVDGWQGEIRDLGNMHRRVDRPKGDPEGEVYNVTFRRYVDPPTVADSVIADFQGGKDGIQGAGNETGSGRTADKGKG